MEWTKKQRPRGTDKCVRQMVTVFHSSISDTQTSANLFNARPINLDTLFVQVNKLAALFFSSSILCKINMR